MSGDGVVAGASPGVAAEDAAEGEIGATEGSVLAEGFDGVLRTGGGEAAGGGLERGDAGSVKIDGQKQELGGYFTKEDDDGGHCRNRIV